MQQGEFDARELAAEKAEGRRPWASGLAEQGAADQLQFDKGRRLRQQTYISSRGPGAWRGPAGWTCCSTVQRQVGGDEVAEAAGGRAHCLCEQDAAAATRRSGPQGGVSTARRKPTEGSKDQIVPCVCGSRGYLKHECLAALEVRRLQAWLDTPTMMLACSRRRRRRIACRPRLRAWRLPGSSEGGGASAAGSQPRLSPHIRQRARQDMRRAAPQGSRSRRKANFRLWSPETSQRQLQLLLAKPLAKSHWRLLGMRELRRAWLYGALI